MSNSGIQDVIQRGGTVQGAPYCTSDWQIQKHILAFGSTTSKTSRKSSKRQPADLGSEQCSQAAAVKTQKRHVAALASVVTPTPKRGSATVRTTLEPLAAAQPQKHVPQPLTLTCALRVAGLHLKNTVLRCRFRRHAETRAHKGRDKRTKGHPGIIWLSHVRGNGGRLVTLGQQSDPYRQQTESDWQSRVPSAAGSLPGVS